MRVLALLFLALLAALPAAAEPAHGIAMYGDLKYKASFKQFDYVNADAPKGGELRLHALGGFDSLNPFIVKGQPAGASAMPFETLMVSSADEPFSEYGLIAETVETPPDRSWVVFTLRPEARFHDHSPILAQDVLFSFETLRTRGNPFYRAYYQSVAKVEALGERKVKFTFVPGENRELPLILGQMPVLSKAYWQNRAFDQTTLEPPLGSGPYRIESVDTNRSLVLARVPDYWGKDLAVNRGQYNFDRIRYDYFRDSTVALEAFKAGQYDIRQENESKKWAADYDFPAVKDGRVRKELFPNQRPTGMQAFVFNLRRAVWQKQAAREALTYAFDFEWTNKTLFYGQYSRTTSYFSNSELAATGLPSDAEKAVLEPLRDKIPESVFTEPFSVPSSGAEGGIRANLRKAAAILKEAGYVIKDGRLIDSQTGAPLTFEILLNQPIWERVALPFADNLKRLGITATIRTVDSAQYEERLRNFDYDMIVAVWGESESPGNEQRNYWGSAAADQPGSRNFAGIRNPAIDSLIEGLVAAGDREALVTRTRALDRVLLANHYVIPHWHIQADRFAFWNKFGYPATIPRQGMDTMTWWSKAAEIDAKAQPAPEGAPAKQEARPAEENNAAAPAKEPAAKEPAGKKEPAKHPPAKEAKSKDGTGKTEPAKAAVEQPAQSAPKAPAPPAEPAKAPAP